MTPTAGNTSNTDVQEWGPALTGPECKALDLPSNTPVKLVGPEFVNVKNARYWQWSASKSYTYHLPADHVGYIVAKYNRDHPTSQPLKVWMGGEEAPSDYEFGDSVLVRCGKSFRVSKRWQRTGSTGDIVGYSPKPYIDPYVGSDNNTVTNTVTITKMTEAEARRVINDAAWPIPGSEWRDSIGLSILRNLNLIREETLFEQFEREHPMYAGHEAERIAAYRAIEWMQEKNKEDRK